MRPLIVTAFTSLDGVMEAPGGGEHRSAGWTFQLVDFVPEAYEIKGREQSETTALLLGRKTYEEFAPVWPSMDDFAEYNAMPKYVVSTTLQDTDPGWPATILRSVDDVAALKETEGGPIAVHGIGRTGTVIGCHLADAGVLDDDIDARLRELRAGTRKSHRASPENARQRDVIRRRAAARG